MKRMWTFTGILVFVVLISSAFLTAQSEQVLYSFTSLDFEPGGVIFDNQGNLYGVSSGTVSTYGRVFELSLSATGWTKTVLYMFTGGQDGAYPSSLQSLVFDKSGNLYGTTELGGKNGAGTVFRLTPTGGGKWTETVIHSFNSPGEYPQVGLVFDAAGNLYGTTPGPDAGTVFEISPPDGRFRILHTFQKRVRTDGSAPFAALTFDSAGNLYGTTAGGGTASFGTVFKLTPTSSGGWTYRQIYSFKGGSDGEYPYGRVVVNGAGVVYATSSMGGISGCEPPNNQGCGTVFQLSPNSDGTYTHTVIHAFAGYPTDGDESESGLVLDASGNLFGATRMGGAFDQGVLFELLPNSGRWQETVLHSFGNGKDGRIIDTQPIMDASGNILGTTTNGGTIGYGTVFEVTP